MEKIMPAATGTYRAWGPYAQRILRGEIATESSGRYKALITTAAFVPNYDLSQKLSDVTNEVFEGNWPQGGLPLNNVLVTLDVANDRVSIMHDDVVALECTFVAPGGQRIIIYDTTGANPSDKQLAFGLALDTVLLPVAGPVVHRSPNGIVRSNY